MKRAPGASQAGIGVSIVSAGGAADQVTAAPTSANVASRPRICRMLDRPGPRLWANCLAEHVTRERVCRLCEAMPGSEETHPFGPGVAVYKVGGRMFALLPHGAEPPSVNLKCDPEWSELLRKAYDAIQPGYHQNKKHWNTIVLDGSVPDDEVEELVAHSYELVVASLPAVARPR